MARWLNSVEGVLRRYPWVIPLGALVPCAYFAARGTNDLVAARLFAADTDSLARALPGSAAIAAASEPEANHHVRDRVAIIHRNIFDSDAGCLDCDAGPADAEVVDASGPPPPEPAANPPEACYPVPPADGLVRPGPCETTAKIVGAVQSDDILWSFVLVQTAATGPAMPYRFGSTLDGRNVSTISWCRSLGAYVLLRPPGGQRCFLAQNMPPHAAPAAPAAPVASASTPSEGGALGGVLEGIERVSPNEFNIRRSTVDRILESQAELMRTTRIMPVDQGGRVIGVQLFGVRGNSLLGRLGMQNGDVLNRINGLDIGSPDRALEAYSRLRTSDQLQVSVTRNGQPVNIDFHIR
jgi:general secretion pathway protein C